MKTFLQLLFFVMLSSPVIGEDNSTVSSKETVSSHEIYEIRQFVLAEGQSGEAIDQYLTEGLAPALRRAGALAVGTLAPADGEQSKDRFVVIRYKSAEQVPQVAAAVANDESLQNARVAFEQKSEGKPPYARINSELLVAMDCMPEMKSPSSVGTEATRVYELRVYESVNETMGARKVQMFNEGEVPIFLDCGIKPVFIGQALVSPYSPSLTYLTAYPDNKAREESWVAFRQHPDWKVLSGKDYYKGTVSKIYKYVLKPLPGSDM